MCKPNLAPPAVVLYTVVLFCTCFTKSAFECDPWQPALFPVQWVFHFSQLFWNSISVSLFLVLGLCTQMLQNPFPPHQCLPWGTWGAEQPHGARSSVLAVVAPSPAHHGAHLSWNVVPCPSWKYKMVLLISFFFPVLASAQNCPWPNYIPGKSYITCLCKCIKRPTKSDVLSALSELCPSAAHSCIFPL